MSTRIRSSAQHDYTKLGCTSCKALGCQNAGAAALVLLVWLVSFALWSTTPLRFISFHCFSPPGAALTALSALSIQSPTASLQSSAAEVLFGILKSLPFSMMHGGVPSEHSLTQLLAGAPPPQARLRTCEAQQAPADFWPRTLAQLG